MGKISHYESVPTHAVVAVCKSKHPIATMPFMREQTYLQTRTIKPSGLRKARARIASGCVPGGNRPIESTVTRLMPLAEDMTTTHWEAAFEASRALHRLTDASVFDLILTLHGSGWRLFSSGSERDAFLAFAKVAASGFDAAAKVQLGEMHPAFSSRALWCTLSAAPRKLGKETTADLISQRLAKAVKGHADSPVLAEIGKRLAKTFHTWTALSAVSDGVGEVIDGALANLGYQLPSLKELWTSSAQEESLNIGVPSIAWDSQAVTIMEDSLSARFAGVVARYLAQLKQNDSSMLSDSVQVAVTTLNANGMSWLLGMGRRAFLEHPAAALAERLQVSEAGITAVEALQASFRALPDLSVLGERVYMGARTYSAASINSLIATYVGRLIEMEAVVLAISVAPPTAPTALSEGDMSAALNGLPYDIEHIKQMYAELPSKARESVASLSVLLGRESATPGAFGESIRALDHFGAWLERFDAIKRQVANQWGGDRAVIDDWKTPLNGNPFSGLISIHELEGEPEAVYPELDAKLGALIDRGRTAFDKLVARYELSMDKVLPVLRQHQLARVRLAVARGRIMSDTVPLWDAEGLTQRDLIDRVVKLAHRCDHSILNVVLGELVRQNVVKPNSRTEHSFRAHLFAGQQVVYAHPMSGRTAVVRFEHAALAHFDIHACLTAMLDDARRNQNARDAVLIEFARQKLMLDGLPDRIPYDDISEWTSSIGGIAPWGKVTAAGDGTIDRSDVIKAFNASFHNAANGLLYRLNRTRFIERADLKAFAGPTVHFVPKDQKWSPPAQYLVGPLGDALRAADQQPDAEGKYDAVLLAKTLTKLARSLATAERDGALRLLAQLPHGWAVACSFHGAPNHEGVLVNAGKVIGWRIFRGYLLKVPRHVAGEMLRAFSSLSISPHTLAFERHLVRDGAEIKEVARTVVAGVPMSDSHVVREPWKPLHFMAIDLGEAGLGVCLKHIESGVETAFFIKTRRIRKLSRQQERYRNREQPRQQFRLDHNTTMEQVVKAAIGEVCHHIDTLMVQYGAVPVFESGVANARGSNKMVQRVFAGVVQRYLYVYGNQAADTVRKGHWMGASQWRFHYGYDVVPAMRGETPERFSQANADAVFRRAIGTPGVSVSGWRSSMICSHCGRDAIGVLEDAVRHGQEGFMTDARGMGRLTVNGETQELIIEQRSPNEATQRAAARRGRRSPWEALGSARWDLTKPKARKTLENLIRRGLRRPSEIRQGVQTSRWVFHCPFADCEHVELADINASRNLVRRYANRVAEMTSVHGRWDQMTKDDRMAFVERTLERKGPKVSD